MTDKTEWRMVPVEPTPEMCRAGYAAQDKWPSHECDNQRELYLSFSEPRWKAMLNAAPTPPKSEPCDRNAVIEECAKVCDDLERTGYVYETYDGFDEIPAEACHCAHALRALKSQPAAPDPRDEVTMDDAIAAGDGTLHGAIDYWQNRCKKQAEALRVAKKALQSGAYDHATEAIAAIDAVQKGE